MKGVARHVRLVLGSFILHFLSTGMSRSFGVIYYELISVFEIGAGETGWIASLFAGLLLGTGLVSGVVMSVVGVCITTIAGSLLMTVGMVTSGLVTNPYLLYLTYGVTAGNILVADMIGGAYCTFCFIGCGASFLYISGNVVINTEFTERRSVAMGIASTGGSVGNILIPLFTSWCIDIYSWRGAFTLLSGLCLQGTIAGFLFYTKDESIGSDYNKAKDTGPTERSMKLPWQGCHDYFSFFNACYVCFVISTSIAAVGFFVPFNVLFDFMVLEGQTKEYSSLSLSLAGVGSIISRVLVGFVGDYKCCHRIYYIMFSVFMCGSTTIACVHLTYSWQFLLYGLLYGMGSGVFSSNLSVMVTDLVGVDHIRPAFGFLTMIHGIGVSLGTPIGGWMKDATGSYASSFYFSAACFIVCGLILTYIPFRWHCTSSARKEYCVQNKKTDVSTIKVSWHQQNR